MLPSLAQRRRLRFEKLAEAAGADRRSLCRAKTTFNPRQRFQTGQPLFDPEDQRHFGEDLGPHCSLGNNLHTEQFMEATQKKTYCI